MKTMKPTRVKDKIISNLIRKNLYKIIWLDTDLKCLIGEGTQSMKHNNNHNFKLYSTL